MSSVVGFDKRTRNVSISPQIKTPKKKSDLRKGEKNPVDAKDRRSAIRTKESGCLC